MQNFNEIYSFLSIYLQNLIIIIICKINDLQGFKLKVAKG